MARRARRSWLPVLLVLGAVGGLLYALRDQPPLRDWLARLSPPPPEEPAPKTKAKARKKGVGGATLTGAQGLSPEAPQLAMPAPKPCLDPPTGEGLPEEGMASSRGLERAEVVAAMQQVVGHALPCFADADSGTLVFSVTAGCDGRVSEIRITDDGGFPTDVGGCVAETLRHAEFPAHDLPDGFDFTYPVTYSAP